MINKAEIDGNGNVLIQGSDNSEITIHMNNPEEIRKFFIDFQEKINSLPKSILELMESKNTNELKISSGANVYLSLNYLVNPGFVSGISFGVTITNLTKENRFFNAPFFKISVPFESGLDSFAMLNTINKITFPKKLEYGEVVTEGYLIGLQTKHIYDRVFAIDRDATIQVTTSTTIGEIFKSNEYNVSQLLESFKYAR
jgi:hypothetical protein